MMKAPTGVPAHTLCCLSKVQCMHTSDLPPNMLPSICTCSAAGPPALANMSRPLLRRLGSCGGASARASQSATVCCLRKPRRAHIFQRLSGPADLGLLRVCIRQLLRRRCGSMQHGMTQQPPDLCWCARALAHLTPWVTPAQWMCPSYRRHGKSCHVQAVYCLLMLRVGRLQCLHESV